MDRLRKEGVRGVRAVRSAAGVGSVCGFLAGVALAASLRSHPAPGQVPGDAAARGFDPHTDILRLAILAAAPLVGGALGMLAARPANRSRRRTRAREGRGARRIAPVRPPVGMGLFLAAVAAHALAVWTFLLIPLARAGLPPLLTLAGLLAASFALAFGPEKAEPGRGAAILAAASPIVPFAFLGLRPPAFWLAVGLAGLVLPVVARGSLRWRPSRRRPELLRGLRALLVWVLLPGSVTGFVVSAVGRAPTLADVFEDGHALLPASEYVRGELPYRDIVPGHGLVTDGLLQFAEIKVFGDDYRGLARGNKVVGALFLPGVYALGWAATASPAAGFAGLLLSLVLVPQFVFFRALLSLWTLALAIYASRSRPRRRSAAWLACGVLLPLGLCVAVDFTVYAAAGVAVALWTARGRRGAHLLRILGGAAVSAAALALLLARIGILAGFLHTTFSFIPALLPVYANGFPPLELPDGESGLAAWIRSQTLFAYAMLVISAVVSGAVLPFSPRVGPRARGLLPVLAWIGCAMLSVIERHHVVYPLLAAPVALLLLHRWLRGPGPWTSVGSLASGLAIAVLVLARGPATFFSGVAGAIVEPWVRPDARTLRVEGVPRARGAVFLPPDGAVVEATAEMIRAADLKPGETWLDFANAPGLYYLFDRDCPIRYYEVPFYETDAGQDEVIAAVEANPRVRTVLVRSGLLAQAIDNLGNGARAPRVAAYLRDRFRPFSNAGGIEFWIRKDDRPVSATAGP